MPASPANLASNTQVILVGYRKSGFGPMLDGITAVLLPALVALFLSAAFVGHGQISSESIAKVFEAAAQADTMASP
jgi:hypothetical protein